jgi:glycosyltransferase involved in cell wall biosynthesis
VNAIASGSNSLVEAGVTGHLVSARDEQGLAARLATLAEDAGLRRRMGEAARSRALGFSWDAVLSGLLRSYREVQREARAERPHG